LRKRGIEVEWVTFETPFFSSDKARQAARVTGIPLTVKDITEVYLDMLKNPPCGYGQHMNPCMDCHALMFRLAGEIMQDKRFDFLFSGEVLGQRPMSQTKPSLRYVEKQSGFDGYILRPLSAKRLPVTIPEKKGMINRELMLDITGRSRKPQMKLAELFGVRDYPAPAGGCLLTDKGYSTRLKDLFKYQEIWSERELHLLKHGRHLRLDNHTKIIVGRTQEDNKNIKNYYDAEKDTIINAKNIPGPTVLIPHNKPGKDLVVLTASICAGYSKAKANMPVDVSVVNSKGSENIQVTGIHPAEVKHFMIL